MLSLLILKLGYNIWKNSRNKKRSINLKPKRIDYKNIPRKESLYMKMLKERKINAKSIKIDKLSIYKERFKNRMHNEQ